MENWQCACAVSRDQVVGVIQKHISNQRRDLPIHYITFEFTWSIHHCKTVLGQNFSKSRQKQTPKMAVFRE